MVVQHIPQNYVFPRIPLNFTVPAEYPDIGRVSNVSVTPQIREYRFSRDELELWGSYQVTVSYFKNESLAKADAGESGKTPCEEFFGTLKIQSDGMFAECSEDQEPADEENTQELYTAHFLKSVHTFVDLESISRPRSYRPSITVERVDMAKADERTLKGELVLAMANRFRRNLW